MIILAPRKPSRSEISTFPLVAGALREVGSAPDSAQKPRRSKAAAAVRAQMRRSQFVSSDTKPLGKQPRVIVHLPTPTAKIVTYDRPPRTSNWCGYCKFLYFLILFVRFVSDPRAHDRRSERARRFLARARNCPAHEARGAVCPQRFHQRLCLFDTFGALSVDERSGQTFRKSAAAWNHFLLLIWAFSGTHLHTNRRHVNIVRCKPFPTWIRWHSWAIV